MTSSLSILSNVADRYAALLDLARTLTSPVGAEGLFPALQTQIQRVLPGSAFGLAILEETADAAACRWGDAEALEALSDDELARLRAGQPVLSASHGEARGVLSAPLQRDGRFLGYLAAARPGGPAFDGPDLEFLDAVARMAGAALDDARVFGETRRRGAEGERLEAIARDLSSSLDLTEVVERVAAQAHELVGRPVVVWMVEGERVRSVARAGGALISLGEERALPAGALERLAAGKEPAEPPEPPAAVPPPDRGLPPFLGFGPGGGRVVDANRLLVPLKLGDRLVGFLAVGPWRADEAPDPDLLQILDRMAPHAAAAIENARLHAEVRRLSLTDPLVQLPNRRQLDLFLEKEFAAAERGRPLCFVLYDLDKFKQYNDTQGHRAGDIALIRFADVLRTETRSMNLAARYGGEEFAAVLSSTGIIGGRAYAERVRRRVFDVFNGTLSVSAGVAEHNAAMETPIDLVVAADRALYRAKRDGRNRVYVAE